MSSKLLGTGWFSAPREVFDDDRLSGLDRTVLLYLYRRAGVDGECWPSHPMIAKDCGICEKTVRVCLLNLRTLGWIGVEQRKAVNGSATSNLYTLKTRNGSPPPVGDTPPPGSTYRTPPVGDTDEGISHIEELPLKKDPPKSPKGDLMDLPASLASLRDLIGEFREHRKHMGKSKALTPEALRRQILRFERWGPEVARRQIEQCIERGWMAPIDPEPTQEDFIERMKREAKS